MKCLQAFIEKMLVIFKLNGRGLSPQTVEKFNHEKGLTESLYTLVNI